MACKSRATPEWDTLYLESKDVWSSIEADYRLLKFEDLFTNGLIGLDFFVPLCGRAKVMLLLARKGHRIVGVEWSRLAVEQFFKENNLAYSTESCTIRETTMLKYTAKDEAIIVYCGNFFAFEGHNLGLFDCVFDNGSIVSVDIDKREKYADIINSLTRPGGRILLSVFDYRHSEHPKVHLQ